MDFTRVVVTCANILTSPRSTMAYAFGFNAERNALLPLIDFIEKPNKTMFGHLYFYKEKERVRENLMILLVTIF